MKAYLATMLMLALACVGAILVMAMVARTLARLP